MDRFDLPMDRFDLLRKTMKEGPGLTLQEWAAQAGVSVDLLWPSRRRLLTPEKVCNLVGAAERMLTLEKGRIERWLLQCASDQGLDKLLTDLLRLVACSKCGTCFERQEEGPDFYAASGLCHGCTKKKSRDRASPHTANYAAYLVQYQSDVRRVNRLLADAILVAANDSSRAVTYAYLGELSGLTSVEVRKILADLDMLKPIKSRGSWGRSRPASGGG